MPPQNPNRNPNPGGGGGGIGKPGGAQTGTVTGFPVNENGGVAANTNYLFIPMQNASDLTTFIGIYDMSNFNDANDGSSYSYRVEDVNQEAVPTVRRLVLTYRDLGLATVTFTVTGSNDNGQVVNNTATVNIGNAVPTGRLLKRFVDISLSAFQPQLSWAKAAGAGPVSFSSITMLGNVEETVNL